MGTDKQRTRRDKMDTEKLSSLVGKYGCIDNMRGKSASKDRDRLAIVLGYPECDAKNVGINLLNKIAEDAFGIDSDCGCLASRRRRVNEFVQGAISATSPARCGR